MTLCNACEDATLEFERTIDRKLVHRTSISEVFLTDIKRICDNRVVLGAHLPRCHGYFNDHDQNTDYIDPLLLLEISRQSTLASAHALDIRSGVILISNDCDLSILDTHLWKQKNFLTLQVDSTFEWTTFRRGVPRAGACTLTLSSNGNTVATYRSSGQLLSFRQIAALREEQRGSPPPWTDNMTERSSEYVVSPDMVGRHSIHNVVLSHLNVGIESIHATVSPWWKNGALFDHSYDHLTMQILLEAARQLSVIAINQNVETSFFDWVIMSISGKFEKFAELDRETVVSTVFPELKGDAVTIPVSVQQDNEIIATIELRFINR